MIIEVKEAQRGLDLIANRIRVAIQKGLLICEEIVSDLHNRYPDLAIYGQYFPDNLEYWIHIETPIVSKIVKIVGEEDPWAFQKWKVTAEDWTGAEEVLDPMQWEGHRIQKRPEEQVGKGDFSPYGTDFKLEIIMDEIAIKVRNQIEQLIYEVLK